MINEVFGKDSLAEGAAYSNEYGKRKFRPLDEEKIKFVNNVFEERVGQNEKRLGELTKHINKRCNALRQSLKNKT